MQALGFFVALAHVAASTVPLPAAYMGAQPSSIAAPRTSAPPAGSDYPDQARREYVDVCSTVNGRTPEATKACTCSINVIASVVPYNEYERAETVLRMRQLGGGYLAQEFRVESTNETLRTLREAQAEADVRCF
jgi:hypothetical protein